MSLMALSGFAAARGAATILAALPAIVAVLYCYRCGRRRERPTLGGFFHLLVGFGEPKEPTLWVMGKEPWRNEMQRATVRGKRMIAYVFVGLIALMFAEYRVLGAIYALALMGLLPACGLGRKAPQQPRE